MGQRLPDFVIIGAQKSGTRWLTNNLRLHPEVGMPKEELHFFDKEAHFQQGVGWYAAQFAPFAHKPIIGEKTPDYLWVRKKPLPSHRAEIAKDMYAMLPNAKLVVVLRNPVERAISAINHLLRGGYMQASQIKNVFVNHQLLLDHGVLEMGFYANHLKAYLQHYDISQMLVLVYERDIARNGRDAVNKTLQFIGASTTAQHEVNMQPMNVSKVNLGSNRVYKLGGKTLLDARTKWQPNLAQRRDLYHYFQHHNAQLFSLLGYEIPEWHEKTRLP